MKKTPSKKAGMSAGTVVAIGAGVLALAAGSYYFFGPEGKKNRGKLKGWMIKMKGEIVEKMEQAKDLSEEAYHAIVDKVGAAVAKTGKVAPEEIATFGAMLKRQWKGFAKNPKKAKKAPVKKAAAKTPAKKKAAKKKTA
jgi:hypothetical protein